MNTAKSFQWRLPRARAVLWTCALAWACLQDSRATERLFTYSYEPETMPQGAMEFEQSVTLRTQRTKGGEVKQGDFNRWEFREELEYGVTDNYTASLYLNTSSESFRDFSQSPATDFSRFKFDGISVENRYQVLNAADHPVGLTLYLEPRFSGEEAEVEQRIILGQRHGKWKWALNLTHATEWTDHLHATEGRSRARWAWRACWASTGRWGWKCATTMKSRNIKIGRIPRSTPGRW